MLSDKVYARLHKCRCLVLMLETRVNGHLQPPQFLGLDGQPIRKCPECRQVLTKADCQKFPGVKYVLGEEVTAEGIIEAVNRNKEQKVA